LLTAYSLEKVQPRPLKRLYDRRQELMDKLKAAYDEVQAKKLKSAKKDKKLKPKAKSKK
jgi:deoxyhypusine synthase